MNKRIIFLILVVIQLSVPSLMIASQEKILNEGTQYKFKTAPVDPYDIFRGRYVSLATDQRSVSLKDKTYVSRGQNIYLIVAKDNEGFAYIKDGFLSQPDQGDYIKTKIRYISSNSAFFNLPIDRYYMNEKKAPKAEALYRKHTSRGKQDAYILVRILNGKALIEGLYVAGKNIEDYEL